MLFMAAMLSCSSSNEPDAPPVESPTRSVLVYMAANNNLSYYARVDLCLLYTSDAADEL